GVIHAAGILDDGVLARLTPERFAAVLAPKVVGARHLDVATRGLALDFFALFSSAAALFGSGGQASYTAANAFLDALAHQRRAIGLPAVSINWGPWEGTGMTARVPADRRHHSANGANSANRATGIAGVRPLPPDTAVHLLDTALGATCAQGAVLAGALPTLGGPAMPAASSAAAGPEYAQSIDGIQDFVCDVVAEGLGIPRPDLPLDVPLLSLGFDSFLALDVQQRLEATWQITLPPAELLTVGGVSDLVRLVHAAWLHAAETSEAPQAPQAPQGPEAHEPETESSIGGLLDQIRGLSDDQVEALLAAERSRSTKEDGR
ncbi:MAG: KR domain-containing protein, partial [Chloroflexota bacterium]